ncbi:MAG: response regulator transcription factor [Bacteroidales bacterium]|nr:response regulator transcription factor [Bacteroidales bacterium]
MKILIADNLSIVRDNVRQVMASLPRNTQVDEVADGQSALEKVDSGQYDVAIIGENIPGIGGLDILQKIRNKHKSTKVLIFSEFPEGQSSLKAFRLGASGYLSRFSALNVLTVALKHIALGDGYEFN